MAAAELGTPRVLSQLELLPISCPPDRHRDGAQLEREQPLHEVTGTGIVRKCGSQDGEDAGREGAWGCGYTELGSDSINFALQGATYNFLGLSEIHK